MADISLLFPPQKHDNSLRFENLTAEVQDAILKQAISSAGNIAEVAGFAVVNKSWQFMVETVMFRQRSISLQASDKNGAKYFISSLTPARALHLKKLTIKMEWPFYLAAQTTRNFSGARSSEKMRRTIQSLADFLSAFEKAAAGTSNLSIVLVPFSAATVRPSYEITERAMQNRLRRGAEIHTMWSDDELRKLSHGQKSQLFLESEFFIRNYCPLLPMVTSLTCPPDFFVPDALSRLLAKCPNLDSINLNLMSKMQDPDSWRTDLFASGLASGAPHISKLTLGRDIDLHQSALFPDDVSLPSRWHFRDDDNPLLLGYIDAIRDYTRNLETIRFDYFAAPAAFYTRLFDTKNLPDQTFQWTRLQEVHIKLYCTWVPHGKRPPMALDDGAHLGTYARFWVLRLFHAAGTAAAKMPGLKKMVIHIPMTRHSFMYDVTLKYAIQSRKDGSMGSIWGSVSTLDFWAAPRSTEIEDTWARSIRQTGKVLQSIRWHNDECRDRN